ncbi:MAG: hypothetical protein AAF591_01410 [Verrucomicrobiota bacterium]
MEFVCGSCGGTVDAPEELAGTVAACPHCGEEFVVPGNEEGEVVYEEEAVYEEAAAPVRREKPKKRPEEKLGWALWVLILLALATLGVGGYYTYVKVPAVGDWVDETFGIERDTGGRVVRAVEKGPKGVFPSGYYVAGELAGVSGGGLEESMWGAPGEGDEWVVVAASVPAETFVMPEGRYEAMKTEYASRFGEDGAKLFPEIGDCRFFDPAKVALVWPDGEEMEGVLINLDFGVFKGFYQAFESHPQPGAVEENWVRSGEQMPVEVAFAMEEGVFDPVGMRVRFGQYEPVALPATKVK